MKKKIYFFNGELGSGKTTLINQLINKNVLGKFFIIENEIASLGIDNQCMHLDPKQIKVMAGECICCSDPKELVNTLKNIAIGGYENVVIESSGATSLNQLLVNILVDEDLAKMYEIGGCVFLVDALGIERTSVFDLEVSDFVVVTKFDALKNISQFERLDKFIKQEHANVQFYVKDFENSVEWIQKLLENKAKTFREWALRVNDEKHHGNNFVKILLGPQLTNFNSHQAYELMQEKQIVRIKGFYYKNDILMHVEMTPEQLKENIETNKIEKVGVVVIGRNKLLLEEFISKVI